jgi:TRAP-type C4-dicarboxylate transport system permease small subunit
MEFRKLYRTVCGAEAALVALFLLAMVLLVLTGAIARTFENPLNWTGDMATFCFAWAVFLCADVAWRRGSMMSFDLFVEGRSPAIRRALLLFNLGLIAAFLLFLAVAGVYLSWISRARSFQGIPEISYSFVTLSLPVGAALLLITTCLKIRDAVSTGGAEGAR